MAGRRLFFLCVALMLAGSVVAVLVPAGLGWDFANFYDAGRRVAAGEARNLYDKASLIAGQAPQGSTGFFGAPLSAFLYVPLSPFRPEIALILFKMQNVLALFGAFGALLLFHRRLAAPDSAGQWAFASALAVACLLFQPFWTIFRVGGQTTPTVLLCLTLGLWSYVAGRDWATAGLLTLATLIKPALAPMLVFLTLVSGLGFLWRSVAVLMLAALVSIALLGWTVHESFLTLLRQSASLNYQWYFNSSLTILIDNIRLAWGDQAETWSWLFQRLMFMVQAAGLLFVAWLFWQGRHEAWRAPARRHYYFTLGLLVFLLGSRTLWEHYLSLLFLPLAYVLARRDGFDRTASLTVWAIIGISIFQNLIVINWLRDHLSFQSLPALAGIALLKTAPLVLMVALLIRHRRDWFRTYSNWPA